MDLALLITQVVATAVIAATLVVYYFQLCAMRRERADQNLLALVSFLQSPDVRQARGTVRKVLSTKQHADWTDEERDDAATTCSSYDIAAILASNAVVSRDILIEHWSPSIKECFEVCEPYIQEMRRSSGNKYWDDFELLYRTLK